MKIISKFITTVVVINALISTTAIHTMHNHFNKKKQKKHAFILYEQDDQQTKVNLCLLNAAQKNNRRELQKALRDHAELDAVDQHGNNALHIATNEGHHHIIHLLLISNANVNAPDMYGFTSLALAVCNNDLITTRMLIQAKADHTIPNNFGTTALDLAHGSIREVLLKKQK